MDSPTFSLYSFFNLLMDSQRSASSSIQVSIVSRIKDFKRMQASCEQMHNFNFFWIFVKRNCRSTIGSLSKKQIGRIL